MSGLTQDSYLPAVWIQWTHLYNHLHGHLNTVITWAFYHGICKKSISPLAHTGYYHQSRAVGEVGYAQRMAQTSFPTSHTTSRMQTGHLKHTNARTSLALKC